MTNQETIKQQLTSEIIKAFNLICESIKTNGISSSAALSASISYVLECLIAIGVPTEKIHEIGDMISSAAQEKGALLLSKITEDEE